MLNKGDGRRHDGGGSTDGSDDESQVGKFAVHGICGKEREHAGDKVQASVDHRRCVNEGRHGRWTFHSIGQPNVERELSGFTHGTDEHQAERPGKGAGIGCSDLVDVAFVEHDGVIKATFAHTGVRVEEGPEHRQTNHEEDVAHTGGQKRLLGRISSAGAFVVEADEQVGTQSHQFPEDEQPEERIGEHHTEHT